MNNVILKMSNPYKKFIVESKNRIKKKILIDLLNNFENIEGTLDLVIETVKTEDGFEQIRKELNILTTLITEDDITDEEVNEVKTKVDELMKGVETKNE